MENKKQSTNLTTNLLNGNGSPMSSPPTTPRKKEEEVGSKSTSTNTINSTNPSLPSVHRPETDKENYSFVQNRLRMHDEKKKAKIHKIRLENLEKAHEEASKFDHSLPQAGEDVDKKTELKKNKSEVLARNTTYHGRETKAGLPWKSIRDHVKSFDLIGFHGGEGISNFIGAMQTKMSGHNNAGYITHVGLAIRGDDFPVGHDLHNPGRIYCWESTMSGPLAFDGVRNVDGSKCFFFRLCDCGCGVPVPSVPTRFGFLGSQFRDLDQLAIHYDSTNLSKLLWCRLNQENRKKIDDQIKNDPNFLPKLMEDWNGLSYNSTCCCIDLCAAVMPCMRSIQDLYAMICPTKVGQNGAQFCSEFAASIYVVLGLVDEGITANKVVPADYLVRKDEKTGEWKGLDVDGEIPLLFDSYWRFTPRSKIASSKLKTSWIDAQRLELRGHCKNLDELILDEDDVVEEAVAVAIEDIALQAMPVAGEEAIFDTNTEFEHCVSQVSQPVVALPYPITSQPKKSEKANSDFVYPPMIEAHSAYSRAISQPSEENSPGDFVYPPCVVQHQTYIFEMPEKTD